MRLSTSSWTVQAAIDALEPGPSATTAVPGSSVDCEWALKIKPDEAAVVSWRCQYPRPPGITIHTRAYVQGSQPEAARLATGGELGLSGSSLARTLEAGLSVGRRGPQHRHDGGQCAAAAFGFCRRQPDSEWRWRRACTGSWYPPQPARKARVMACSCPERNRPSLMSAHWQPRCE